MLIRERKLMKAKTLLVMVCLYGLMGSAWGESAEPRDLPVYTLSPQVHVMELEKTASKIPTQAIRPFLVYPRVVSREAWESAPYVVAGEEGRLLLGAGDTVYVRGLSDALSTQYGIYQKGDTYRDPERPHEILGYEALFIADIKVKRLGDPARVYIQSSRRGVMTGDRLLPKIEREIPPYFFPRAPSAPVEGKIIDVVGRGSFIGQNEVVVLNLGAEDDIERGTVLGVYQADRWVRDTVSHRPEARVRLPGGRAGKIMVYRVFDHISYALVMRANRVIHLYDTVRNP